MREYSPSPLVYASLKEIETLVSPARHLSVDRPHVLTGGYGRTHGIQLGQIITPEIGEAWLQEDVHRLVQPLYSALKIPLEQHEFDALIHFAFNVGLGDPQAKPPIEGLLTSTLFRRVNEGRKQEAAEEFSKWIYAGGVIKMGLVKRRLVERDWFLGKPPVHLEEKVQGKTGES